VKGRDGRTPCVAIVDYGLGNLFSVLHACRAVGLHAEITRERATLELSDGMILPGVGAFGDAMETLRRLDLVGLIRDAATAGKPVVGICLGIQLLMEESEEFGRHEGLGLIPGRVVKLREPREAGRLLKVPQVGWNRIGPAGPGGEGAWAGTLLEGVAAGAYMYFVHSYVVAPADPTVVLSTTRYGDIEFCSSVRRGKTSAFQFHPERSGRRGLRVYENLRKVLEERSLSQRSQE
jgi:imidazole glycerol-phosphate synthase subunit HisH